MCNKWLATREVPAAGTGAGGRGWGVLMLTAALCAGATRAERTASRGSPPCAAPADSPSISTDKLVTGKHKLKIVIN